MIEKNCHVSTLHNLLIVEHLIGEEFDKARSTVVRTNLCIPHLLEVKGKGFRGVGGIADNEAYTVHTINIIS
jgi:hypothetical protein